jgi:hypothetical protein
MPYMAPNICMFMPISVGTTRNVGGWPGMPKKRLGTVVTMVSGETLSSPMRLPSIHIRMKR